MGSLIFTLTLLGTPGDVSSTLESLTWTDTILTFRNQEALKPWESIAQNMTLNVFATSSLMNSRSAVDEPDGENFLLTVPMLELFWHELRSTIHAICVSAWNAFLRFVSGDGGTQSQSMLDESAMIFWNHQNYPTG